MPYRVRTLDESPELDTIRREIEALQDREKVERQRIAQRRQLLGWLKKHPLLTARDLVTVAQLLKPKRGKKPVKTETKMGFSPRRVAARTAIGIAMVEARKRRNLSIDQAASLIGNAPASINAWEGGHVKPGPEAVARMVKELGMILPGPKLAVKKAA
jgi:DNA-binding transcriptional regulator YiaG